MEYGVELQDVTPQPIAAVHAVVPFGGVASAFRGPLDAVWAFLRRNPGLHQGGHNLFLYHHSGEAQPDVLTVDFGVQVTRAFEAEGDVRCVWTPSGVAACVVHRGPYSHMHGAHTAIHQWCRQNGRRIGAASWEIYGDWSEDPSKLETTIFYLLE